MSIAMYRKFWRIRKESTFSGKVMPYRWGALETFSNPVWMPYTFMFDEFSREIANIINAFSHNIDDLTAWDAVTEPLPDIKKMEAGREFVDNVATSALCAPYVIRSRFLFAAAHLCHQANRTRLNVWVDNLPIDKEIFMDAADLYGKPWKSYKLFKSRIERISGNAFKGRTKDFRNAYNHRFSPRFMFGYTSLAIRQVDKNTGNIFYGIGGEPPLQLNEIVDSLVIERDLCYAAFDAFQALVREHESAIAASQIQ